MKIIGLTGGIASGKNFVAEVFAKNGAVVFDADKEVHQLLELDKSTFREVNKFFPESVIDKKIDRKILGKIVFDPKDKSGKKLKILEKILHVKVRKKYQEFLKKSKKEKQKFAVLNIPLLLETEGYDCDKIVAIITSKAIQKKRFLERAKKNHPKIFAAEKKNFEKKFEQIRSKQLSNLERKKRADFVIKNDGSKAELVAAVKKVLVLF
jgi:dephospho-CoA kinase